MKMLPMLIGCLALATLSHGQKYQNPGFISIDCGAPNNYDDKFVNISYKNDDGFVDSGTNRQVSIDVINTYYKQQSKNLRTFPNGTRNCYTLEPNQGKGHKYLIRAQFWYGNHDGKNQIPIFDLHIDVNYWTTVNFSSYNYIDIIYTPPRDYLQVCLVNIGLGVPFISALELRLLNDSIYPIDSGALVTYWRFNVGSKDSYRHPQDDYDRIWAGVLNSNWSSVSNTSAITASTSNDDYKVPTEVLMTALQAKNVKDSLGVSVSCTFCSTAKWYVYLHFAELEELNGLVRDMTIRAAYKSFNTSQSVRLESRKPVTVIASLPLYEPHINITVSATAGSTLPPLLNAIEFYIALDLPNSPSYLDDVNAIKDIKKAYGVMRDDWQGDPCVPRNYLWSGLNCNSDNSPRIISLNLSASRLAGEIITSFSNLTAIVSLDLSDNHLTGSVPKFFAQFSSLKNL